MIDDSLNDNEFLQFELNSIKSYFRLFGVINEMVSDVRNFILELMIAFVRERFCKNFAKQIVLIY